MKQLDDFKHLTLPPPYIETPPPAVEQPAIELDEVVISRQPDRQPLMEAHRQPGGSATSALRLVSHQYG